MLHVLAAFFFAYLFLYAAFTGLIGHYTDDYSTLNFLLSVNILFCWAGIVYLWQKKVNSLVDPFIFFMAAALVFNAGHCILNVLFLLPSVNRLLNDEFPQSIIFVTQIIVLLSLACWGMGGLLAAAYSAKAKQEDAQQLDYIRLALRRVGWSIIAVSIAPAFYITMRMVTTASQMGYGGIFDPEFLLDVQRGLVFNLARFFPLGVLCVIAGSRKYRQQAYFAVSLMMMQSGLLFYAGTRSLAAFPLLMAAWVWDRTIARIPRAYFLTIGIFMFLVVFPLVSLVRGTEGVSRMKSDFYVNAFKNIDNPLVSILDESGASMKIAAWVYMLTPETKDYLYGESYVYALFSIFPNLFWDIHPSAKFQSRHIENWLTGEVDAEKLETGGGYGFSFIGESYLNFGWLGVTLFMILQGWLFARFILWGMKSNNPARIVAIAVFSITFVFYARSDIGGMPRVLLWFSVIPYLVISSLARRYRRQELLILDATAKTASK